MSAELPILSLMVFAPAAGALLIMAARWSAGGDNPGLDRGVKLMAFIVSLLPLGLSLYVLSQFEPNAPGYQFVERSDWALGIQYHLGVDGISLSLLLLTTALMPICFLASWSISRQVAAYMTLFLLLETLMLGVFCALDIVLFYVFFEAGLIPMFIMIGVWGGKNRVYAAFKFFLFTLLGSLLFLVALIVMITLAGTSSIPELTAYAQAPGFERGLQTWLWLALFASFAVKMPMWPVHTWLPDAHVEAPTAASMVLAAILLKMGGYGFIRFSLPMLPDASVLFQPLVFSLSVVAIIYASLVAFRQTDIKKLIAYSSVAHMGFVTIGIFTLNAQGLQGAMFQMISHGIISGALFLCVGVLYDRMHSREIADYGGVVHRMPVYAAVFMLFTMGNVGLPGTAGFVGEILTMTGAFLTQPLVAAGAAVGVILSAVYALTLYRRVAFGPVANANVASLKDMDGREWLMFAPLVVGVLVFGLFPSLVLEFTESAVTSVLAALPAGSDAVPALAPHAAHHP